MNGAYKSQRGRVGGEGHGVEDEEGMSKVGRGRGGQVGIEERGRVEA